MQHLQIPEPFNVIALDTVGSTNTEAKRLADEGIEPVSDFTLIWAKEQTAGKGRRGRSWTSPPGNLYTSIVLRPDAPVADLPAYSFIAALAVVEALKGFSPTTHQVHCKWPNDVLVNGKKVAGILMETASGDSNRAKWLVIGMGLNVGTHPEDTAYPATSLSAEGWDTSLEAILGGYCERFLNWSQRWEAEGFDAIRRSWLSHSLGQGEPIRVRLADGDVTGIFEDMDETGALVINEAGNRRRITAGDVFFW